MHHDSTHCALNMTASMQLGALCAALLAVAAASAPLAAAQARSATRVAAATAAAGSHGARGAANARAAGIPVDAALLASHPEFANVPVGPPSTDSSTSAISAAVIGNISMPGNQCSRRTDYRGTSRHHYVVHQLTCKALFTALAPCLKSSTAHYVECGCVLAAEAVVGAGSRVAAMPFQPIASDAGYVRSNGRRFSYDGKEFWRECAAATIITRM